MLKYLVQKEFIQFRRNHFLPRMILVFPLMIILVLPFAASFEIRNINVAVVDHDGSTVSRRLVDKVASSEYFRIAAFCASDQEALRMVELGTADTIMEIPYRFAHDLEGGKQVEVLLSADTVNGTKGSLGSLYLTSVVQDFTADLLGGTPDTGPVSIESQYRYNPNLSYPDFMVPALMVIGLMLITGFLPALNIVGEKEAGTIESMNVTPVRKMTLILSKLIPYWLIGFFVFTFMMVLAYVAWGLFPAGSIPVLYLAAGLFVLTISGFGLIISNYANTYQQAMFMMFFFVMIFDFLSGLFTPIASMPEWAKLISYLSPLRYMIEVLRGVYLRGCGIRDFAQQFVPLTILMIGFNSWAIISYRKKQ